MSPIFSAARIKSIVVFLVVVTPVFVLGIVNFFQVREDLTDAALSRRESIAYLTASVLHERLNRLVDVGTALATRESFQQLVEAGDWDGAAAIVRDVPTNFPYIERIVLTGTAGTIHGDTVAPSDIVGQNFAFRDWYQGVSREWKPYISEAFKAAAAPFSIGVVVAIPIQSDAGPVGIVAMQVVAGTLLEWAENIDVGVGGFVYFTDQRGQLLAHPQIPTGTDIVDFSSAPAVQRALAGESGTGIFHNPIENSENVVAYAGVEDYRWGVIVSQPAAAAFAERDRNIAIILGIYGVILFLAFLLAYSLVRLRRNEEENIRFREGTLLQIVHDLRAPSNVIRLVVAQYTPEFLEKYPELKQDAERIQKANARMLGLIQNLFEIAKGEREGLEFRRDPVNVAEVIENALLEMKPAIQERGLTVNHQQPASPPVILGDWDRLKEVFVNLIDNAVKYNRSHGSIAISYETKNRIVSVRIQDTGVGIAKENLPKLFLPYFREQSSAVPGTGLGLFIVKNFVEKMGGRIEMESNIGKGTALVLAFPSAA